MSSHAPTAFNSLSDFQCEISARNTDDLNRETLWIPVSVSARSKYELTIHRASILAGGQAGVPG
jgi:hypothetical protein